MNPGPTLSSELCTSGRRYVPNPAAHIAHSASFITALAAAAGQTSAVLIKDRPQNHFQRRGCEPEDIALEVAEAFAFGDGVGALEIGFQKPDFGNAFGNVIVAASLHVGETVVTNDLDAQERDSRRRLFQVELLAQQAQILALFAFFVRVEARFLEFMIGDGVLHSLADKIDPLLNLALLFGECHILGVFFGLIACVNGEVGFSVPDALLLDGPDAAARFTLGKPLVETGEEGRSALSEPGVRVLALLPPHPT